MVEQGAESQAETVALEDLPADFWQDYHEQADSEEVMLSESEVLDEEGLAKAEASPATSVSDDFGPLFATLQSLFPGKISHYEPFASEVASDEANPEIHLDDSELAAALDSDDE